MRRFTRLCLGTVTAGFVVVSCASGDTEPSVTTPVAGGTTSTTASETVTTPVTSGTSSTTEAVSETVTTPVATTLGEGSKSTRAADLPLPFTEVAGAVWEGRIVVVGGMDAGGEASDRTYVYDPGTDTWETGPNLPVALHHTAAATIGDRIYVVGGYSVEDLRLVSESAVWSLGPDDESWRAEPDLTTARGALAVVSTGDRLFAIAGVGPDADILTSTEMLEPGDSSWRPGPDLSEPREHLAATAIGEEVYVIAGRTGDMSNNMSSVEVLIAEQWEDAPPLNFSRGGIGATTVDDVVCVAGGEEPNGTIGTVECLLDGEWQVVAELEVPRHGLAVVTIDDAIHVVAGGPLPGLATSGVHEVIHLER